MAELQLKKMYRLLNKAESKLKEIENEITLGNVSFELGYSFGVYYGTSELLKELIKEMES